MPIDFQEEATAIDFQEEAASQRTLADFLAEPDATLSESSPLTPSAPRFESDVVERVPASDAEMIARQAPVGDVPLAIGATPATVPRFGAPGTITRGVSDTLSGLVEWALNKPEEALATLTPLAPAIAARYAPEIALQFGRDVTAGVKGDREAIGRALSMAALVGGPVALRKGLDEMALRGGSRVSPEAPGAVAAQLQQPGTPDLTGRDLRYLARTREPVIEDAPRVVSAAPEAAPGEVIAPELMRSEEARGRVERPPVGIDITNAEGVRFGPEFWSFEPDVPEAAPRTVAAAQSAGEALRAETVRAQESAPAPQATLTTPPAAPIGMGGATPSEFRPPPQTTSTKNAVAAVEREALNLPPAFEPVRRADPEVWAEAKARIDADPAIQDKLLADLRTTPRAVTDVENDLLLHRKGDLKNEYNKNARDLAQAVDDGRFEDAALLTSIRDDLSSKLLDVFDVLKKAGTETARGLRARQKFIDQDFDLASMVTERRAVNEGRPLTPRQQAETSQAQADIVRAIKEREQRPGVESEFELDRAKRRWNEKLANDADANASAPVRALQKTANAINDVRTIVTSYDLSALLRQGKIAMVTHPFKWASAIPASLKAALSPMRAFKIDHEIANRPNGRSGLYARSDLYLAEAGHKLTGMEEAYLTRGLARHVPGVKASERAYTTFLNKVRADLFDSFVATLSRDGQRVTLPEAKVLANYINVVTGRGDLGKFNAAAQAMATVFFAPRYVTSRFQYLLGQPLYYGALSGKVGWKEGARARKLVAGEYARALLGFGLLYGTYAMFMDTQNYDHYSSDFLKLRAGDTRIDPWAGLQQATVLLSREIGGKKTTVKGKTNPIRGDVPYGGATAVDVGAQFLRTKLAPVPGAILNALQGKDVVGNTVTPGSTLYDLTVPITYQDIFEALEAEGMSRATALSLLSIFGEGVQTYNTDVKRGR